MELNLILILICATVVSGSTMSCADEVYLSLTASETNQTSKLLRQRGYIAEDHLVVSDGGYLLNVVQAKNPLTINASCKGTKEPILFIPGSFTVAESFFTNPSDVKPKNYCKFEAGSLNLEEFNTLLTNEPASGSLVFTALNFGHEVWLMNRRGTPPSLGHLDKSMQPFERDATKSCNSSIGDHEHKSGSHSLTASSTDITTMLNSVNNFMLNVNSKYWNFSLDEQANFDLPATVNFILETTKRKKVSIVGHSSGASLPLMALSGQPKLATKLSKLILWAPAMQMDDLANRNPSIAIGIQLMPFLMRYSGPILPASLASIIRTVFGVGCNSESARETVCLDITDILFGPSRRENEITPFYTGTFPYTLSSHELVSILQAVELGKMHHYDYKDLAKNMIAYGKAHAPIYNLSKIVDPELRISLWTSEQDLLVSGPSGDKLTKDLVHVPVERHHLKSEHFNFNHVSFMIHKNVSQLVVLPTLRFIESP